MDQCGWLGLVPLVPKRRDARQLSLRDAPNESAIAFDKGELVSQACFEQDGYTMVAANVGSRSK